MIWMQTFEGVPRGEMYHLPTVQLIGRIRGEYQCRKLKENYYAKHEDEDNDDDRAPCRICRLNKHPTEDCKRKRNGGYCITVFFTQPKMIYQYIGDLQPFLFRNFFFGWVKQCEKDSNCRKGGHWTRRCRGSNGKRKRTTCE